jgi:protein TonB
MELCVRTPALPWALAWTSSVGVHALLLLALALVDTGRDAVVPPIRVWIEPAPPPPRQLGNPGTTAPKPAAPIVPPAPEPPRPEAVAARKEPPRKAVAPKKAAPAHAKPPPPQAAALPRTQGVPQGAVDSDTAGVTGGVPGGIAHGRVGGRGTAPLTPQDVTRRPELVHRVLPDYPRAARAQEIEGQVMLEVVLDRAGAIEDEVRVVRSLPLLDQAAIDAVKQWRFRPARDGTGQPVRVRMVVPVRFVLR